MEYVTIYLYILLGIKVRRINYGNEERREVLEI